MTSTTQPALGQRLKQQRLDASMTIEELSRASEVATGTISDIENGHHDPRADTLAKLLKGMGHTQGEIKLF